MLHGLAVDESTGFYPNTQELNVIGCSTASYTDLAYWNPPGGLMGANCYGRKPATKYDVPAGLTVLPFNRYLWSTHSRDACSNGTLRGAAEAEVINAIN